MFIKADNRTWIEVPDDATEEFKKAKVEKYFKEKQESFKKLKSSKSFGKTSYKQATIGALYDKRINISQIMKRYL